MFSTKHNQTTNERLEKAVFTTTKKTFTCNWFQDRSLFH